MAEESPFIEESPEGEKVQTEAKAVDVDALLQTLEKFEVQSPEKLHGRLQNANDYASMRSERDQLANEMAQLRAEIMNRQTPAQPEEYYGEEKPVDIDTVVGNAVTKAFQAREQAAFEHQKRMNDTWVKITGHKRYNLVKDEFESALKDPKTVMQLQSGQVDAFEFYSDLVMDKMAGVAKQTVEAFKEMKGSTGANAPHIESNASVPQYGADNRTAEQKKVDELMEKAKKSPKGLPDSQIEDLIASQLGGIL